MTFYERVERLCTDRGIKVQNREFMAFVGVSSGTITNWKQKGAEPEKISTYSKIADYFGITLDYLVGRVIEPVPPVLPNDYKKLLTLYRESDDDGKTVIMSHAIQECRRSMREKEKTDSTEESAIG